MNDDIIDSICESYGLPGFAREFLTGDSYEELDLKADKLAGLMGSTPIIGRGRLMPDSKSSLLAASPAELATRVQKNYF
ncbi:hypothetical protein [Streptomyces sp. G1]|uniref:hypothetical protein n=1 Tax=Streptomyces sp. G1 TaxID=361572 RepID=UPI00202FC404|nr:hypothetical protein [Streptomyces sp. G1]MCM1967240.1 hypothetical protein [Streptomyces sp. G1]